MLIGIDVSILFGILGCMTNLHYTPVDTKYLVRLVEVLAPFIDRSEATISQKFSPNARLFSRLRAGLGCNIQTYEKAFRWFSDNWPEDLEWPSDVPRPAPSDTERKAS